MAITLTDRAAKKVRKLLKRRARSDAACLRVAVAEGGCGGLTYKLSAADAPGEKDATFESGGVTVVCDRSDLPLLDGTEVDFCDELMRRGFVFDNPNAKDSCSCGGSFSK